MKQKKDLRIIKTQNLLYNTLTELLRIHPFEEIKVSDICNKALINRSTFYSHYTDKYELLMDYINNQKELLLTELEKNEHIINTKEYYMKLINLLLNYIEDKKEIYYDMLINNKNSIVMDMLLDVAIQDVEKRIKEDYKNINNIPSNIVTKFYLTGVITIGLDWLKDNKYTKKELITYLDKLIPNDIEIKNEGKYKM